MIEAFNIYDHIVVILYFVLALSIGIFYSKSEKSSAEDYFLANRNMSWILVGFSLFATCITNEQIVGLIGSSVGQNFGLVSSEWIAIIFLILLGWIFAPLFLKNKISTVPQIIGNKFGHKAQKLFSGLSIFSYIIFKIGITLVIGGYIFNKFFGFDFLILTVIMLLVTGIYTVIGGLRSVMYTQFFQAIVIILALSFLAIFGLNTAAAELGSIKNTIQSESLNIFQTLLDPTFPWLAVAIGGPILAAWYWLANQYVVQRVFSSKDINEAKKGSLLSAGLIVISLVLFVFPGFVGLNDNQTMDSNVSSAAYLTSSILPSGINGLLLSGLFALFMSTLASAFNSTATLIAYDFFKTNKSEPNDDQLIYVGRLTTIVLVFSSIIFIGLVKYLSDGVSISILNIHAYISPPIVVVFLLAIFLKRATSSAIIWTLLIGESIGFVRIIKEFFITKSLLNISIINDLLTINYLYFSGILFALSCLVFLLISLLSEKKSIVLERGQEIALNMYKTKN